MTFEEFNRLDQQQLQGLFESVCHCKSWAQAMTALAPFSHVAELLVKADELWAKVGEAEILESMQGHARIGDLQAMADKFSKAATEQGQVAAADPDVIAALFNGNKAYEEKFGFIFIVFATGKSADTMLRLLQRRLANSRDQELREAQRQQALITENRLQKLFLH